MPSLSYVNPKENGLETRVTLQHAGAVLCLILFIVEMRQLAVLASSSVQI